MANMKAVVVVLVIIIVGMAGVMIRLLWWDWCRRNFCPNGCCIDENENVVIIDNSQNMDSQANAPPPSPKDLEGQ